jgi:hypothetical protein
MTYGMTVKKSNFRTQGRNNELGVFDYVFITLDNDYKVTLDTIVSVFGKFSIDDVDPIGQKEQYYVGNRIVDEFFFLTDVDSKQIYTALDKFVKNLTI